MSGHIKILLCHLMHYVDIIRVRNSHTVLLPCGGGWITQSHKIKHVIVHPPKNISNRTIHCVRWEKKERKKISIGSGVGAVIVKEDFLYSYPFFRWVLCNKSLYPILSRRLKKGKLFRISIVSYMYIKPFCVTLRQGANIIKQNI